MSITKFDDFLVHQLETTFDHVIDSDPRWHERYWFNVHDTSRRVAIAHGLGVYPNSGLMDGFAGAVWEGTQCNVRASRGLNHERWDTAVGPIAVSVVKGLRTMRIALGPNEQGVEYDLTLEAVAPPYNQVPMELMRIDGRVHQKAAMFAQCGRVSGWVKIGGESLLADPKTWWYAKSNCWGIRSQVGGPEAPARAPRSNGLAAWTPVAVFVSAQFADRHVCIGDNAGEIIYQHGDPRGHVKIAHAAHNISFVPGTIRPARAETTFTDVNGGEHRMAIEPLATVYLNGGSWGAYKDYYDGLYRGEKYYGTAAHVETERIRVSDAAAIAAIAGRDDHVCQFRLGDDVGYGVFEVGVRGEEPYAPFDS